MTQARASGHTLTEASENYLKAIYHLRAASTDGRVATSVLAEYLAVAPASVTGMLQKLAAESPALVDYAPRRGVALSALGEKVALEVIRHHRLIELYLFEALGYPWDEVHAEAERLEHVISEAFEDRVAAMLGDPEYDPHGQPIPRKDGTCPEPVGVPLSTLAPGHSGRVARVADDRAALLRYLASVGIVPGARVEVVEQAPFGGPMHVRVGDDAERPPLALGAQVTDEVFVDVGD